jgi:glyoxylase-like metal-dependent hydrolase (beta-lactamase superfamily II)
MEVFRQVFSPIEVNTYILASESGECAVIDCGCYTESEFLELAGFLEKKKLHPVLLLNTHCHLDHLFGNRLFMQKYGIGTYCHEGENQNLRDSVLHAGYFGLSMEPPPRPGRFIADGEYIDFAGTTLQVLHVPGHSPGSLAFFSKTDGVVFTGDALFAGSIGRSDLPGGNHETLIRSIRMKLFELPPETIVYPGHGEASTIKKEINTNPFFR